MLYRTPSAASTATHASNPCLIDLRALAKPLLGIGAFFYVYRLRTVPSAHSDYLGTPCTDYGATSGGLLVSDRTEKPGDFPSRRAYTRARHASISVERGHSFSFRDDPWSLDETSRARSCKSCSALIFVAHVVFRQYSPTLKLTLRPLWLSPVRGRGHRDWLETIPGTGRPSLACVPVQLSGNG